MSERSNPLAPITLTPIGIFRSPFEHKADAPRQPRAAEDARGWIELSPGRDFDDALCDLEGWDAIFVLFWMDRAKGWRPKVLPPRSSVRRGVFSTRAPRRPNPIGLSVMRLEHVEGLNVHVREVDILDGTPILDIKPYVPWADSIPNAATGWLEQEGARTSAAMKGAERPQDVGPSYSVSFSAAAEGHLAFLAERGVDLRLRIEEHLIAGPLPHAYRRIKALGAGQYRLREREFMVFFRIRGSEVNVETVRAHPSASEPEACALRAAFP